MPVSKAVLDRSQPPAPGPVHPFSFPAFRRFRLSGGMVVLAARLPRVPLVALELFTPAGAQHDPPDGAGLATLTAALLDEGTGRRGATEIAALVERLGGRLTTGAGWNAAYVTASVLTKDLEVGLGLLAEIALDPSFPEPEVERLRRQRLGDLLQGRTDSQTLASDAFARAVYGDGVYGRPLIGDEASVGALTREQVMAFHRLHNTAAGSCLVAIGDLDPEHLAGRLEEAFASALSHPPAPQPQIVPRTLGGVEVHLVHRPKASQTEVRIGHAGVAMTHPDYNRLQVLNAILGGKFTSRINLNLRERHGYTYGAHSRFVGRRGPGPFLVSTAVDTEVAGAAVAETLGEIRRIQEDLVSVEELADTKSYLNGIFVGQLQSIGELASRLSTIALYDLPADHWERYLREIEATTREDVLDLARRYLRPEKAVVVTVGPREALEPQVARFGELHVSEPPPPA